MATSFCTSDNLRYFQRRSVCTLFNLSHNCTRYGEHIVLVHFCTKVLFWCRIWQGGRFGTRQGCRFGAWKWHATMECKQTEPTTLFRLIAKAGFYAYTVVMALFFLQRTGLKNHKQVPNFASPFMFLFCAALKTPQYLTKWPICGFFAARISWKKEEKSHNRLLRLSVGVRKNKKVIGCTFRTEGALIWQSNLTLHHIVKVFNIEFILWLSQKLIIHYKTNHRTIAFFLSSFLSHLWVSSCIFNFVLEATHFSTTVQLLDIKTVHKWALK